MLAFAAFLLCSLIAAGAITVIIRFWLRLPIRNPHRTDPDQLTVGLFTADVVVAGLPTFGDAVLPNKLYILRFRLNRLYVIVVFDDVTLRKRRASPPLD